MNNINKKSCLWLFISISIVLYVIFDSFLNGGSQVVKTVNSISKVVTVQTIIILIFIKYLWKHNIFKDWLVIVPDLSGAWKGTIYTTWEDPLTGTRPEGIPVLFTINQTLFNVSCVMRTSEMTSYSFLSGFNIDKENQIKRLISVYDSSPKQTVRKRSPQHFGTIIFQITEDNRGLSGDYWTGRETSGSIELKFWTKKKKDVLPVHLGDHPIGIMRNYKN